MPSVHFARVETTICTTCNSSVFTQQPPTLTRSFTRSLTRHALRRSGLLRAEGSAMARAAVIAGIEFGSTYTAFENDTPKA